jgi:hypothetical protein
MSVEPVWLVSPHDRLQHVFPTTIEHDYVEALCEHTAPADRLKRPDELNGEAPGYCMACQLFFGDRLADRHENTWR